MNTRIKTIDLTLFVIPLILLAVSVVVIYSLVMGTNLDGYGVKQGIFAIIGLAIAILVSFVDYRHFRSIAWIFYVVSILLLLYVDFFGKTVNGAMNWIDLKFFQLQPSEIAKVFSIVVLASFLQSRVGKLRWLDIFVSVLIMTPTLYFIMKEPDAGTAMVLCFIYLVMLLAAKPKKAQLFSIFGLILIAVSVVVLSYFNVKPMGLLLKDYQRQRIAVFLDPSLDPYKSGYNVQQAQITIGSGGLTGKGLGQGPQSQLQFLPEAHTDFIFAGIAESFGFAGSLLIIFIFGYLIYRLLDIAKAALDNFGTLIVIGVAAMIFFQVVISVGMNLGLLPVTGIPLPLLSYGGTSLFVTMFSLGLAQSVFIRHKKIAFH
ncbi:MAG: rod shape-determining protein RodA [Candidatus Berkelbacteria bacterium]|nr:rod shape-determining protein RodA [Candidatus Berkelbacteria bacterium]